MDTSILYKLNKVLIFIFFIILGLIYGKMLLIPLAFSILFSLLIMPVAKKLEFWGLGRGPASFLCVILITFFFLMVAIFFYTQVNNFIQDWPILKDKTLIKIQDFVNYFENLDSFGIEPKKIASHFEKHLPAVTNNIPKLINILVLTIRNLFFSIFLIGFEILFLLYYRTRIYNFVLQIIPPKDYQDFKEIIASVQKITSNYLFGLLTIICITTTLNVIGLLLIGINYAVTIGLISGLFTMIPFIGVLLGSGLAIFMGIFTTNPTWSISNIIMLFTVNQLLENNIWYPYFIGLQFNLNSLITVNFLILGGLIWGIPGIILFVPLLGIIKVVLEHIDTLKPYAYVIEKGQK